VLNNTITPINATVTEGIYQWKVNCTSDNATISSVSRQIIIDQTSPVVTISSPLTLEYNTSSIDLNYTTIDLNIQSCWYSLDGAANQTLASCQNITLSSLGEGNHTLIVYANDSAGNVGYSTVSGILVNTSLPPTHPELRINSPSPNTYYNTGTVDLSIGITANDVNNTVISILNSSNQIVASTNTSSQGTFLVNLSFSGEGVYSVEAISADNLGGNISANVSNLVIDLTPPSISINSPASDSTTGTSKLAISLSLNETNLNYINISVINSEGSVVNSTTTTQNSVELSVYAIGVYNLTATAYDLAGNSNATESLNVTVDKLYSPPTSGGGSSS
jgi:hypothetical protein